MKGDRCPLHGRLTCRGRSNTRYRDNGDHGSPPSSKYGGAGVSKAGGPQRAHLLLPVRSGACSPALARTLQVRGLIWRNQGDYARARADLERALAIHEATRPQHPDTAVALTVLGDHLVHEGAIAAGKQLLDRAVALSAAVFRVDHPHVASALRSQAFALQELGDLAGARALRERALAITERSLGTDNPRFAVQLDDFAATLFQHGDYAGARTHLERAPTPVVLARTTEAP